MEGGVESPFEGLPLAMESCGEDAAGADEMKCDVAFFEGSAVTKGVAEGCSSFPGTMPRFSNFALLSSSHCSHLYSSRWVSPYTRSNETGQ